MVSEQVIGNEVMVAEDSVDDVADEIMPDQQSRMIEVWGRGVAARGFVEYPNMLWDDGTVLGLGKDQHWILQQVLMRKRKGQAKRGFFESAENIGKRMGWPTKKVERVMASMTGPVFDQVKWGRRDAVDIEPLRKKLAGIMRKRMPEYDQAVAGDFASAKTAMLERLNAIESEEEFLDAMAGMVTGRAARLERAGLRWYGSIGMYLPKQHTQIPVALIEQAASLGLTKSHLWQLLTAGFLRNQKVSYDPYGEQGTEMVVINYSQLGVRTGIQRQHLPSYLTVLEQVGILRSWGRPEEAGGRGSSGVWSLEPLTKRLASVVANSNTTSLTTDGGVRKLNISAREANLSGE